MFRQPRDLLALLVVGCLIAIVYHLGVALDWWPSVQETYHP